LSLAKKIVRRSPPAIAARLRKGKRDYRRARYRLRQRLRPVRIDQQAIASALRAGGVETGDTVFFQSAMSSFGEILGGSATPIAALEEVVGAEGLVVMPSFPTVGTAAEYLGGDPVFDLSDTPSTMGAVTERFRKLPGTYRSIHPTHSVSARGPCGAELVAGHESAATPFGAGTPFVRLIERNAWQVWFGCGVGAFTMYHAFECRRDSFPLPVFLDRRYVVRCVDRGGQELRVSTLVHDFQISQHRIDARADVAREWRQLLEERGVLTVVPLGRSEVLFARMDELMTLLEQLLKEGKTIYDLPVTGTA
jgi:aminoglycoside 3-N-acetyltransferase